MDATELKADSFVTAGGTFAAYALIILGMAIVLFGIPFVLFTLL